MGSPFGIGRFIGFTGFSIDFKLFLLEFFAIYRFFYSLPYPTRGTGTPTLHHPNHVTSTFLSHSVSPRRGRLLYHPTYRPHYTSIILLIKIRFRFQQSILTKNRQRRRLHPNTTTQPNHRHRLPTYAATSRLTSTRTRLYTTRRTTIILSKIFLRRTTTIIFCPRHSTHLFLFRTRPRPTTYVTNPRHIKSRIRRRLFNLVKSARSNTILSTPTLHHRHCFRQPPSIQNGAPHLFRRATRIRELRLTRLFVFRLVGYCNVTCHTIRPNELCLSI